MYDAVGEVVAKGQDVEGVELGDRVYYAGGVGSIMIQLAKQLTNLNVIATASRPETEQWVRDMGADHVVNHRHLVESVREQGIQYVDYIFNVADTKGHWDAMVELIAPQGMISSIVEFEGGVDLSALQGKSTGFSVDTLKDAHQRIESSASIGKTAIKY